MVGLLKDQVRASFSDNQAPSDTTPQGVEGHRYDRRGRDMDGRRWAPGLRSRSGKGRFADDISCSYHTSSFKAKVRERE